MKSKKPCFSNAKALTHSLLYRASRMDFLGGKGEQLFKKHIIFHLEFISGDLVDVAVGKEGEGSF